MTVRITFPSTPQIQPHLKKCFDNIKKLDMCRVLSHHEATHMNSSEGEKVPFKAAVRLEGVVEVNVLGGVVDLWE